MNIISLTITLLSVIVIGCSQKGHADKQSMKSAYLVVTYPIPRVDNFGFILRDTFQIHEYGDYTMYVLPHKTIKEKENSEKTIVSDHLFYLFTKNSKYGFEYHSLVDTSGSMRSEKIKYLAENAFAGIKFPANHSKNDSLIRIYQNPTLDSSMEQYTVRKTKKGQFFDTSYYYYSKKMNAFPYSLSPELDSLKGMKLFKAQFILAPMFSKKDNMTLPLRSFSYELVAFPDDEIMVHSIANFIDRFKKALSFK